MALADLTLTDHRMLEKLFAAHEHDGAIALCSRLQRALRDDPSQAVLDLLVAS